MKLSDYPAQTPIEKIVFEGTEMDIVFDYEPFEPSSFDDPGNSESICFIAAFIDGVEIFLSDESKTKIERELLERRGCDGFD